MDDLINQYNNIGKEYVEGQKNFFAENGDLPLKYIENIIGQFQGLKILDLGCGDGHDIAYFQQKYQNEYFGIDASGVMINKGKENLGVNSNLFVGNFEQLPFEGDSFDIVYAKYAFSYIDNFEKIYKEASRVLKKGGLFIFIHNHPINDFTKKKERYPIKETLKTQLFSTKTEIIYYSHTFGEIISRTFLENFNLLDFTEDYMFRVLYPTPVFIGITAKNKIN